MSNLPEPVSNSVQVAIIGKAELDLSFEEGETVGDLMSRISELRHLHPQLTIQVNGQDATSETVLNAGDNIILTGRIRGGQN